MSSGVNSSLAAAPYFNMDQAPRHQCMIYEGSPATHLPGLAEIIRQKLSANIRCLFINAPEMVVTARSCIAATGVDVTYEIRKGALVLSSSQKHIVDGRFDVDPMIHLLEEAVNQALADGHDGLWATGDMAWEFGSEGDFGLLLEYEYALEELFKKQPALSGICQYHRDTLPIDAVQNALYTHQGVYVNEALSRANPYYDPRAPQNHPTASALALQDMLNAIRQPFGS